MIDKQTFRDAMARLAAAVNIVTSDGPGGLCGCTASAVCSVSDEPPILLVCINRSSRNNAILKQNLRLCVNVLRADQQVLAMRFAQSLGTSPADARFAEGSWSTPQDAGETLAQLAGAGPFTDVFSDAPLLHLPALNDALVSLDCRITDSAEVGSHTVFYCLVEVARIGEPGPSLVYYERNFHPMPSTSAT